MKHPSRKRLEAELDRYFERTVCCLDAKRGFVGKRVSQLQLWLSSRLPNQITSSSSNISVVLLEIFLLASILLLTDIRFVSTESWWVLPVAVTVHLCLYATVSVMSPGTVRDNPQAEGKVRPGRLVS